MHDLVIRNARIVDGSGEPAFDGDIAVQDGHITQLGRVQGEARRSIDADGDLLTPGFVDIHTHFDGQVCWDKQVTPSCWHGVTTVVMGNCGVGFAPVRPGSEGELVSLMESVEDIPGTALHDGMPWGWETFAEYLDAIDTPYSIDIGTQVPHAAIRHYVMGDRCYDDATRADMDAMAELTREGLAAGALGFSTSRFYGHVDSAGNVIPGTNASSDEIRAIASAFNGFDHGTIEIISDHLNDPDELAWIEQIARDTGRPLTTLVGAGKGEIWSLAERLHEEGVQIRPQVGARPASILMTLEGTINPMRQFPAYREIHDRPLAERIAKLRDPEFRARVLAEPPILPRSRDAARMISNYRKMYLMDAELSYEPSGDDSVAAVAERQGVEPVEVLMDTMASGVPLLFLFGHYPEHLDGQKAAIEHPRSVFGLSDGGAHVGVLCDASVPTYMLAYFTRDRVRGDTLPLEFAVHKMTRDTAELYGLLDRGLIACGYRADLNLIDYEGLKLEAPEMVYDLPAGGKRLIQRAQGYRATICAGQVTYEDGEHTGALPGRLLRGGRALPN